MEKKFIALLSRHGALRSFKKNLNTGETFGVFLRDTPPVGWVSTAFPWCSTKQGDDFWMALSDKWEKQVEKQKKKHQ